MRTSALLAIFVLCLTCDTSANQPNSLEQSDSPLLIIWQDEELADAYGPRYPTGLIAAVWSDGRMIRAKDKKSIGRAYIEGRVDKKNFSAFLGFLTSPTVLSAPDDFAVAVDGPSRCITINHAGKKHSWTRTIPDDFQVLNTIEARSWALPLERAISFSLNRKDLQQFRAACND